MPELQVRRAERAVHVNGCAVLKPGQGGKLCLRDRMQEQVHGSHARMQVVCWRGGVKEFGSGSSDALGSDKYDVVDLLRRRNRLFWLA